MANPKGVNKVTYETKLCGGCRSCELACSFHHRKIFQPGISSIEIKNSSERIGFTATLYREDMEGHIGCDRCKGFPIPMCVQFCPGILRDELEHLLQLSHLRDIRR